MNDMAKLIRSDTGQSVELPEGFQFDADEVHVRREGERVVLEPADLEIDEDTGLTIAALRALIEEGMEGESVPLDIAEIKRAARENFVPRG